ncbi:MAG: hypothetical protein IJL67_14545 [Oscillospiraceae bacterium]|nr:hypothetical protein [Oscillospiraceae bacterium]
MKNRILSVLVLAAMIGLTSCGVSETTDKTEQTVEVVTEAYDDAEEKTEDVTEPESEEVTETAEETTASEVTAAGKDVSENDKAAKKEFKHAEGLSDKYADFDNMAFAYKGQIFKFGEATLADLANSGIEMDCDEELDDMIEDCGFASDVNVDVYINPSTEVWLQFTNNKDNGMIPASECVLTYAYFMTSVDKDYSDDGIQFNFPLDLTEEELTKNSGEPNETEFDEDLGSNFGYTEPSRLNPDNEQLKDGYFFGFNLDGKLMEVCIAWDCNV